MMLTGNARIVIGVLIEICMLGINVFMLWYGIKLVKVTWYQWISDFPELIRSECPICQCRSEGRSRPCS